MADSQRSYDQFLAALREISLLHSVASLLDWDERTQLPPKGAEHRANQSALLARMGHEKFTSPAMGEMLAAVEASDLVKDADSDAAANARLTRRDYDRATKIPPELVEAMTHTAVMAQQAWAEARKRSDYSLFAPWLEKTVELKRREAACVGFTTCAYDALLDAFEPLETAANLRKVFASLRQPLVELIAQISHSPRKAPVEILERRYPVAAQEKLSRLAAEKIGFDFAAGRLDVTVHPFCSGLGPGDTRLTTRYDENSFGDAFFGVLHETGHGLYNQGLPRPHYGTPLGHSVSLGIHESQSRMWENLVGRSRAFWSYFLPHARGAFPGVIDDVKLDQWVFAINDVRPSFIRVESDQATYNLHILLRFELEQAMLEGQVKIADIPGEWNALMQKYLGISPPDDARGCLQDIHWSGGAIGYFPTYTLGNLYAAQFFEQARQDLGDLDAQFTRGEFAPLLDWLRKNIHQHGRRYSSAQLVKRVTGKELSAEPLLRHLRNIATAFY